jgi:hypothetical protein
MKTSKNLFQADKSKNEATPMKIGAGILLKPLNIILMLLVIAFMSSCFVRGPGNERHGDRHHHDERHDERH